jgi:hypothetical protein
MAEGEKMGEPSGRRGKKARKNGPVESHSLRHRCADVHHHPKQAKL